MIKKNSFLFKYVNVPINNIRSRRTSDRRTILSTTTDFEYRKFFATPSRNSKTDSFLRRRTEFRAKLCFNRNSAATPLPPPTRTPPPQIFSFMCKLNSYTSQ
jgi:hypothetical protein